MPTLQFVTILCTTFFTGAAIYINLVEHPARMQCRAGLAATEFGPSYRRAAVMHATLALIATFAGVGAWLTGAPRAWFSGAVLIFAVVPFTLLAIMPTNKKLLDPALDRSSEETHQLLQQWGRLHAVRSILGLAASIAFLASIVWS